MSNEQPEENVFKPGLPDLQHLCHGQANIRAQACPVQELQASELVSCRRLCEKKSGVELGCSVCSSSH